ncbi:MAG: dTDP-4-dehydrorhamnose 3,5-epimerase [Holophagaceae bacterium]|nr:dTDP-4-dehydrorhamnose 3,5-epimerase [Holophagaceae bacterium]
MKFIPSVLGGAFRIEMDRLEDERGFFARTWCGREAELHDLIPGIAQCNISFNRRRGTLRGMHFQAEPHREAKLVRCTRGAVFDVILDLRPGSPTFKKWEGFELDEENGAAIYVPEGFAHGFQTLSDDAEVHYQMSEFFHEDCAKGVRWNDPAFGIDWPVPDPILSAKDAAYPDFTG